MQIQLRLATTEDIPALDQLMRKSVRGLSAGYYTERQIEISLVHVFGIDTQLIADGTYFIAEANGQLAGCGGWSKRRTLYGGDQTKQGEDNLLDPETEPARIRAFFVDPDFARQAVAAKSSKPARPRRARLASANTAGATLPGIPLLCRPGLSADQRSRRAYARRRSPSAGDYGKEVSGSLSGGADVNPIEDQIEKSRA